MSTSSPIASWETQPFYFRTSEKSLFGCYHRPRGKNQRDCGIVLCHPLGQEYIRSHRTFRQLAISLSRAGFPILRFDFTGCGDSEGDCEQWRIHQWKTDIESGIAELKTRGKVEKVCLIGLRLGATLARMAGANRADIKAMVLWDPVINGMDYVAELKSQHQKHLARYGGVPQKPTQEHEDQEVIGFTLTKNFLTDLQPINLLTVSFQYAKKILFIQSAESPFVKDFESQIRKSHPLVEFQHLPSHPIWIKGDALTKKLVPQHIIKSLVSWTSEVFQ
jgi:pimeloyl-ACP methyl ester carboxylesterase